MWHIPLDSCDWQIPSSLLLLVCDDYNTCITLITTIKLTVTQAQLPHQTNSYTTQHQFGSSRAFTLQQNADYKFHMWRSPVLWAAASHTSLQTTWLMPKQLQINARTVIALLNCATVTLIMSQIIQCTQKCSYQQKTTRQYLQRTTG